MSAAQQTLYIERLRLASIASTALHPSAAAAGASRRSNRAVPSQTAASHFADLRKAANHPLLLRSHYTDAMIEQIARAAHAAHVYGEQASLAQVRAELSSASDFRLHTVCAELAESSQVLRGVRHPAVPAVAARSHTPGRSETKPCAFVCVHG